jgi:hypothetical protein
MLSRPRDATGALYDQSRGGRRFPARRTLEEAMTDSVEGSPVLADVGKVEKTALLEALAKDPARRSSNRGLVKSGIISVTAGHEYSRDTNPGGILEAVRPLSRH